MDGDARPERDADRDDADAGGGTGGYYVVACPAWPGIDWTRSFGTVVGNGGRVEPAVAAPEDDNDALLAAVWEAQGRRVPLVVLPGLPGLRADPGRPGGAEQSGTGVRGTLE